MSVQSLLSVTAIAAFLAIASVPAAAQKETAAATAAAIDEQPEPLTEEELEVLVARIALYPDELVAVIVASSLSGGSPHETDWLT
jgi:hypothetical protein